MTNERDKSEHEKREEDVAALWDPETADPSTALDTDGVKPTDQNSSQLNDIGGD